MTTAGTSIAALTRWTGVSAAGSGPGDVMVLPQWGQGPAIGGRSFGTRIFPLQWLHRNSRWF
jgi:hypothetical protein